MTSKHHHAQQQLAEVAAATCLCHPVFCYLCTLLSALCATAEAEKRQDTLTKTGTICASPTVFLLHLRSPSGAAEV